MLTTAKPVTIIITAIVITSCIVLNPRALLNAVLFMICRRRLSSIRVPVCIGRALLLGNDHAISFHTVFAEDLCGCAAEWQFRRNFG